MDWNLIAWVLLGLVVWLFGARLTATLLDAMSPEGPRINGAAAIIWPLTWGMILFALAYGWLVQRLPPLRWLADYLAKFGAATNASIRAHRLLQRARLKP